MARISHRVASVLALLLVLPAVPAVGSGEEPFQGVALQITDLGSCSGCSRSLERALERVEGVRAAALDTEKPLVRVEAETGRLLDETGLRTAVRDVGYTVGSADYWLVGIVESEAGAYVLRLEGGQLFSVVEWAPPIEAARLAGETLHLRARFEPSEGEIVEGGARGGVAILEATEID